MIFLFLLRNELITKLNDNLNEIAQYCSKELNGKSKRRLE